VDSDYLFGNWSQRRTYGSRVSVGVPANFVSKRGPTGVVISRNMRITRATRQQYARRCADGFRTARWRVVLLLVEVAAEGRLGP